jgi:prevent-host-death family protein
MSKVTAFEAKTRFGELLDRVSRGEEVVITRHDKVVARLVPEGPRRLDEVRRAVSGLLELQSRIRRRSRAKLSDREVRAAIEEGRS